MKTQAQIWCAFDRAAASYDEATPAQAEIAISLVDWAAPQIKSPQSLLDLGCGTGHVTKAAASQWPQAEINALDAAPAMLNRARLKVPHLRPLTGDAAQLDTVAQFDLILSSMSLHWLPDPRAALLRWQQALRPGGLLAVALPVAGSFGAWVDLCAKTGQPNGLWPLPAADFAIDLATQRQIKDHVIMYSTALDFLRAMKQAGAHTPRAGHRPALTLRRLLHKAPQPFPVTYRILYLGLRIPLV
jgi:malonyl-CoA O-methyltransferase